MSQGSWASKFFRERADLLKLLAHPVRLQILDALRRDEECVCHLSAVLRKPQPYVSQQLAVLRNAGLIADRKVGSNVFYHLAGEQIARQVEAVLGPLPGRQPVEAGPGHEAVAGCPCPKCRVTSNE